MHIAGEVTNCYIKLKYDEFRHDFDDTGGFQQK